MPFDPNVPGPHADLTSEMFRGQYNGLKEFIDAQAAQIAAIPAGPQGPPGPGFNLRGEYVVGTTYQPADVVTWNGNIYLANSATTQPPDVYPDWSPLGIVGPQGPAGPPGPNLAMLGDWLDYQTYVPGDVVAYNNQIYVTMSGAVGTPPDQSANWRLLSITGPAGEVTMGQLNATIQTQCPRNVDGVQFIDGSSFSAEGQAIVAKINELLAGLHNPV